MDGWIKLHRKILEWEWYSDLNTKALFLHLLLTVNHKEKKWMGITILSGSRVCSYQTLSEETGITVQSVRTSITKLKSTGELTSKSNNKFTVITINNYNDYQQLTSKLTSKQQATNKQLTTNNKDKKEKNEKKLYTTDNLTLEEVSEKIVGAFNLYLGTKFKNADNFKANLEYWLGVYEPKDIARAVKNIKADKFWCDKMTPTMLFRRKNPQGEPVDYISQLLLVKENYD